MRLAKFLMFIALTLGLGFVCTLALLLRAPRRRVVGAYAVHVWSKLILRILRVEPSDDPVSGAELDARRNEPRVIVANHLSYLDIPVLASRRPCLFLAKKEIGDWPILGRIAQGVGTQLVDRDSLTSRAGAMLDLQNRLREGFTVVIFPEGTTSLEGPVKGLRIFYGGAFRLSRMEEKPLELVYLDYDRPEEAAWLGDDPFIGHLWGYLGLPKMRVRVRSLIVDEAQDRVGQRRSREHARRWILGAGRQGLATGAD